MNTFGYCPVCGKQNTTGHSCQSLSLGGEGALYAAQAPARRITELERELTVAQARIAELEAKLAKWEAMPGGWQPISTAPDDGTPFLAKGGVYDGLPFPCRRVPKDSFNQEQPWLSVLTNSRIYTHALDSWMPLPEPPLIAKPEGK